ncbi:MAG: hypothetical protein HXS52_00065 [Theionarchaea archaeon]|nr:hypothetical protein [Theionarchaea archaeon]MBU7036296.1 hypothetical protein [Theionarchaea archaeon]
MVKLLKDTMTLKEIKALDVYKEVIGFMAVNGYYLNQSVEPVKIVGKKKVEAGEGILDSLLSSYKSAELHVGLWQRGTDLTVVLDFTKEAASDADTIKGILLHRFGQEKT